MAAQSSARLNVQMATAARRAGLVVVVFHSTSDTVAGASTACTSSHIAPPSVNASTGTCNTAMPSPWWWTTSTVRTWEPMSEARTSTSTCLAVSTDTRTVSSVTTVQRCQ